MSVLAGLIILGTLYDVIAVQMKRHESSQERNNKKIASSVNGVNNEGYFSESDISHIRRDAETSLRKDEIKTTADVTESAKQSLKLANCKSKEAKDQQASKGIWVVVFFRLTVSVILVSAR